MRRSLPKPIVAPLRNRERVVGSRIGTRKTRERRGGEGGRGREGEGGRKRRRRRREGGRRNEKVVEKNWERVARIDCPLSVRERLCGWLRSLEEEEKDGR